MRRYTAHHEAAHAVVAVMLGVTPERVLMTADGGGINVYPHGIRADELTEEQAVTVAGTHQQAAVVQQLILHAGGMAEQHAMAIAAVPLAYRLVSLVTCAGDRHAIAMLERVAGPLPSHMLVRLHAMVTGLWWPAISAVATLLEVCGQVDGNTVAAITATSKVAADERCLPPGPASSRGCHPRNQ